MQIGNMEVNIYAQPGVFILGTESASGKSYLYTILKSYIAIPSNSDKVLILTYIPELSENYIISSINSFNGIFILLDRFDLYFSKNIVNALLKSNKPCLVDLKTEELIGSFEHYWASVALTNNCLEVRGYVPNFRRQSK